MTTVGILDFDGALSDGEAEGVPFTAGYLQDLARLAGISVKSIEDLADEMLEKIKRDPDGYGFEIQLSEGHRQIMAPALPDPYLRMVPIARMILGRLLPFLPIDFSDRLCQTLFPHNYKLSACVFRPDTKETLEKLMANPSLALAIVTNSDPTTVSNKLARLNLAQGLPEVIGGAKKYMPVMPADEPIRDAAWKALPETLHMPDLSRPVYVRRPHYFLALDGLRRKHGVKWVDMKVAGDSSELDLFLPLALGARVGLLFNDHTPPYEIEFMRQHPRATLIEHVSEIPAFFNAST